LRGSHVFDFEMAKSTASNSFQGSATASSDLYKSQLASIMSTINSCRQLLRTEEQTWTTYKYNSIQETEAFIRQQATAETALQHH
jgi:hypothetical protein